MTTYISIYTYTYISDLKNHILCVTRKSMGIQDR